MAAVKRIAAKQLKSTNKELAAQLEVMWQCSLSLTSYHHSFRFLSPDCPNCPILSILSTPHNLWLCTPYYYCQELADEIDASHARFEELTWDIVGDTGVAKGIE